MKPLVVVGASLAGMGAAQSIRSAGYDGPLTVLDASPVLPHDRPPLSKQVLAGEWDLERAAQPVAKRIDELELDLRLGVTASSLDATARSVCSDDGSRLEASAILIATGSAPRTFGGDPLPEGTHTLRTGADSVALRGALEGQPPRVVVVGAGFIGAEVAATCRSLGLEVTMLEAADVPLGRVLPGGIGGFVADLHRDHGVDVRLSARLERITVDDDGHTSGVELAGGEWIEAPVVLVGIGAAPVVDWLDGSGLVLVDPRQGGGVAVDETLLAAPGVVVAGDVAAWPNPLYGGEVMRVEQWENAIDQGTHAGTRALAELDASRWGEPEPFVSAPWFWSDQYGAKIQMVGRAHEEDVPEVVSGSLDEDRFVVLFRRGEQCSAVLGVNRPRQVMQARMAMSESLDWDGVAALF